MSRWTLRSAGLLLAVVVGLTGCTSKASPPTTIRLYADSERVQAPALSGDLLSGGAFDPGSLRGQVIVVNFWASWCAPCRVEADDLENTYIATKADGVTFLGVNTNDLRDKAKAFLVGRATYPSLFDPAGKVALRFKVPPSNIPATVIIDRQGRVAAVIRIPVLQKELQPLVAQLAAEPAGG